MGGQASSRQSERYRRWQIDALHSRKGGRRKATTSDPTQSDEDPIKHRRAEHLHGGYLVALGAATAEDKQTTASDNILRKQSFDKLFE